MNDARVQYLAWVAADWGSSNLRVWGLDQYDQVMAHASSDKGMLALTPAQYEAELLRLISNWLPANRQVDVVVCGMAGARQGWLEAAYLPVPTSLHQLGAGAVTPHLTSRQLRVYLLPGLSQTHANATHFDVMRGEETQLAGLLAKHPHFSGLACLPGTHSKWAHLKAGTVTGFSTYLTGELYQLLARQSVLKHSIGSDDLNDELGRDAFMTAVRQSYEAPGAFSSRLFGLRAQDLLDTQLTSNSTRSNILAARLSGLVIGLELSGASCQFAMDTPITLIGNHALCQRYTLALDTIGRPAQHLDGSAAVLAGLSLAHYALKETA